MLRDQKASTEDTKYIYLKEYIPLFDSTNQLLYPSLPPLKRMNNLWYLDKINKQLPMCPGQILYWMIAKLK